VSLLQDRAWKLKYTLDDGDLVRLFYVRALRCAQRYDRVTGYFSARALALAVRGVEGLVLNDGRMRLLVGCTLKLEEIAAVERGESIRNAIERQILATPDFSSDPRTIDEMELLAWMIARGYLDVKVAIPCDLQRRPILDGGIFHEKSGIIEDKTGDRIAFSGSVNETAFGWTTNWESFNCFTSWNDGPRVDAEESSFAKLWADKATRAMVFDVPTAVREKLLGFLPDPDHTPKLLDASKVGHTWSTTDVDKPVVDQIENVGAGPSIDEERRDLWRRIANAANNPVGGERVGEATSAVVPWAHQVRAFERMYHNWPPKLLIADEVGLGKTIQAGLLLRQAWLAGRIHRAIVLAPKSVCKQWQIELREKFNLNWPIYDGQKLVWDRWPGTHDRVEKVVGRGEWHHEPFVIMSSHLARRQDRRSELLNDAEPWDVVVLDEAHHARRKAAGSSQEGGPNALLRLMSGVKSRTQGLVLLTATPLQIHAVELWDLLNLLGLPPEWTADAFDRFFQEVRKETITNASLDWLSLLFRGAEKLYGQISRDEAQSRSKLSSFQASIVLKALREDSSIPRKQLNADQRKGAIALIRRTSPVRYLISRHTRELLRRYAKAGKIDARIANRKVEDKFIHLSHDESALYTRVEDYISHAYNAAAQEERNAVGFIMTIYRRRLASSFYALRNTLEKRRSGVASDEMRLEEDAADLVDADEEVDAETLSEAERKTLVGEEIATINDIVNEIGVLPTDTKAVTLVDVLKELQAAGYPQAIVFTQFTDTMDYLRDHLVRETGHTIMCFSGRGGEVRGNDGAWKTISREDVKRRFRERKAEILVCTDAAAEGLNFQFCGALVNYDMPWNPMRVEQRIGRIDRLGQLFADIRIVNLHYADTVEADVYRAARDRIKLFESVVGGLQPILARLPTLIQNTVLEAGAEPERTDAALRQLDAAIEAGRAEGIDLDDFADADLDMPQRPDPAISLADLHAILVRPKLLPKGAHATTLDAYDFRYEDGELRSAIRVTTDREFFEMHADSVEFWTPGSPAFPSLAPYVEK
jgi:superfamily II DNA or RNA helicase